MIPEHVLVAAKEYAAELEVPGGDASTHRYYLCLLCGSLEWASSTGTGGKENAIEIEPASDCGRCAKFRQHFPDVFAFVQRVIGFQQEWFKGVAN